MLRRVKDQRRVKNGEAERREDLNEKQRGRPLRSSREPAFKKSHPVAPISLASQGDVKPPMMPEALRFLLSTSNFLISCASYFLREDF